MDRLTAGAITKSPAPFLKHADKKLVAAMLDLQYNFSTYQTIVSSDIWLDYYHRAQPETE